MDRIEEINLRRNRARHMAAAVMKEIDDCLPDEVRAEVHGRLLDCFHRNGLYLLTDQDRAALKLEPRDDQGWTPSERIQRQQEYLRLMLAMSEPMAVRWPPNTPA